MILQFLRHNINKHHKISAFMAGALCAISHAPLFFTPGLIGFSILVYLIHTAGSLKEAISRNIAFGYGYFGCGLYWISIGISVYINDFWWMIPICLFGVPLVFCLFTSFAAAFAWHFRASPQYVLIYAVSWMGIEWLTNQNFIGLPWMLAGYTMGFSDVLSQMASFCGVLGISFVIFNIFGTFYYIWGEGARILKRDIYYFISILSIISLFGMIRLENNPSIFLDTKIRIIQPSIPQLDKWNIDLFWKNIDFHKHLSLTNTGVKPDIILWSEAAVTAPVQAPSIRKYLNEVAKSTGSILITGAVSEVEGESYTSATAFSPRGTMLFDYHKHHLVPFGEYVPFKEFLPIKKLTAGFEDYASGNSEKVFSVEIGSKKLKIRPLICYESVFASEVTPMEADLMINFTNNAWFGDSAGPYQHFYIGKFRAIENSIPMVVVANNGISGVIDPAGRIISRTNLNDKVVLDSLIPKAICTSKFSTTTISYLAIIFIILAMTGVRSLCAKLL